MRCFNCSRLALLAAVCLSGPAAGQSGTPGRSGGPAAARTEAAAMPFSRQVLLARFDGDDDGRLNARERTAARDAFGGIDVPLLRWPPRGYRKADLPAHFVQADMAGLDNTPADNPLTDEGAALGRVLFYDRQLSRNNTVACASCHHQQHGFSDPRRFSVGYKGERTARNAMGLANLRFSNISGSRPGFFWDERAATLEEQVLMPIQDEAEMGMDLAKLEEKLEKLPYYPPLFEAAFGTPQVTRDRIAKAVAQFLRSLASFDSRFDRAARAAGGDYSRDFADFTAEENLGKSLFIDGVGGVAEIGCAHCHVPPTFGMPKSFNNGLELHYVDRGLGARDVTVNDPFSPSNDGKFKAPSLRNVALTAPYMHDGRFRTLEEVVEHYSSGVHPHPNLGLAFPRDEDGGETDGDKAGGRRTSGFRLTAAQKAALVAFLKTLTDEKFVSDPRFSDPFVRIEDDTVAAARYEALLDEYEREGDARSLAPKFIEFAEAHANEPAAADALLWVVQHVRGRTETTRALELLAKHHARSAKLGQASKSVAGSRSVAAEKLLRAVLEQNPDRQVQARAAFHLAALLDREAELVDQLQAQPKLAPRVLQYYGKEYGRHLASLNLETLTKRREEVYERILKSFPDVEAQETTMGKIAAKALFAIRRLSVGRPAPEIEGEDIFGKRFKLSDYRGKIVMLTFWGHW